MVEGLGYVGLSLSVVLLLARHAWGAHWGSPIDISQTGASVVVELALWLLL